MDASGLQCIVCPLQPVFSDLSHLLTHLGSKAHLAHHFKLGFRKGQANAAAILIAYDNWYKANNLGSLLADRDAAKTDRQNKRTSSGQNAVIPNSMTPPVLAGPAIAATTTPGVTARVTAAPTVATPALPDYIDPRLGEPYNAVDDESDTNGASLVLSIVGRFTPYPQADDDRDPYTPGNTELASWDGQDAADLGHETQIATLPVTPQPLRTRNHPKTSASCSSTGGAIDRFEDSRTASVDNMDTFDKDRPEEATRLKGVLWPGMDLFDAATQEMRRKRNQKKDGTLLKKMEMTSQLVEPTEQIFSSSGVLLKEREITGNVEAYSPLKGETPVAKKGPLRGKSGILRERDANIPRARDRKRLKRENPRSRDESEDTLEITEPDGFIYHKTTFGSAYDEEVEDLRLSMAERPRKRLTVFKDEQDQEQDKQASNMKDMQAPRGTLAPAQLVLNNTSNISHNHGHRISLGKENIEPILNIPGRIDPLIWNPTSPFLQRSDPEINGDPPSYFYDGSNTGLGQADGQDQYGYRFNPLLGPTSKTTMFDHHSYSEEVTLTNGGWTANSRAMASDAGIVDGDDHPFIQMILNTHPKL